MVPTRPMLSVLTACFLLLAFAQTVRSDSSRFQVGFGVKSIDISVGCRPTVDGPRTAPWRNVSFGIEHGDADFLVFRFAHMKLPPGFTLQIRNGFSSSADSKAIRFNSDQRVLASPYYTKPIHARRAVVELMVPPDAISQQQSGGCFGFHIDQYRFAAQSVYRGAGQNPSTDKMHRRHAPHYATEISSLLVDTIPAAHRHRHRSHTSMHDKAADQQNTCVSMKDESENAACVRFNARVFEKSSAIARLLIHKEVASIFCTGWLLGCEGHVITNRHCVADQSEANATFIEFLAQGKICRDQCNQPLGCPGVVEATSSQIVAFSPMEALDYTLLLPRLSLEARRNLTQKYGFLTMRSKHATLKERIFIPQHPAGFGKRVALKHRKSFGRVVSLNDTGCNQRPESVGYFLDTKGGSSGSPVIAYSDRSVVGLHYCGGCVNSAIPSHRIVQSLVDASKLPRCALAEFQWPPPTANLSTTTPRSIPSPDTEERVE